MLKKASTPHKIVLGTAIAAITLTTPNFVQAYGGDIDFEKKTLRYGHVGPSVRVLQEGLKKMGYYPYLVDGIFGPQTQIAVRKFQLNIALAIDGIADPETLTQLFNPIQKIDIEQFPKLQEQLEIGSRGFQVTAAQKILQQHNYYSYNVDGIFGKITHNAVIHFQKNHELEMTGIIDEATWEMLHSNNQKPNNPKQVQVKKDDRSVDFSIIDSAREQIGTPFKWGGNSPSGFDCSGFVKYVFSKKGINIPRTVNEMWNYAVDVSKPSVGDIVFFQTYKPGPSHAGIYIGDGKFIHSDSTNGVIVTELSMSYWNKRYLGAKRIVQYD